MTDEQRAAWAAHLKAHGLREVGGVLERIARPTADELAEKDRRLHETAAQIQALLDASEDAAVVVGLLGLGGDDYDYDPPCDGDEHCGRCGAVVVERHACEGVPE